MPTQLEQELRGALGTERVALVVGAGVSAAAARLPGWSKVIESGFEYARGVGVLDDEGLTRGQVALGEGRFPDAAQVLKRALGAPAGEYPRWLKHQFGIGRDRIVDGSLLDAVIDLPYAALATTNFDHLLSLQHPDALMPVTWRDAPGLHEAVRDGQRVLHIHGSYDDATSVIFGIDNYESLAAAPAYEAVIRTLWLDRVLLFIGCSFDGLTDPDFRRLIDWASQTFKGTPHKHYALMQTGTFTTEQVRQYLNDWRIQIVPYGVDYSDLPITLRRINPHPDRAYARRLQRARALLAGSPGDSGQLAHLLASLAADSRPTEPRADLQARADQLLSEQKDSTDRLRGDLRVLQTQARLMVDAAEVERQYRRWADGQLRIADDAFRSTVLRASGAVYLFSETLLQELHRRGVHVHEAVVSNYVHDFVDQIAKPSSFFHGDAYTLENAARVLNSLTAILDCDPDRVFPFRQPGTKLARALDPVLLVCRADRLELRDLSGKCEASLPNSSFVERATALTLEGSRVVVFNDRHGVRAWDPLQTTLPTAEFTIGGAFGIFSADHRMSGDDLVSVVASTDGPVYLLRNLRLTDTIAGRADDIDDVVMMPGEVVWGLGHRGVRLCRYQDGRWDEVLSAVDLDQLLPRLPTLDTYWPARVAAHDEEYRDVVTWHANSNRYQHPRLTRATIGGQELLSLNVTLFMHDANDQALLFFDTRRPELQLRASCYRDGRVSEGTIVDFATTVAPGGRDRLITARLSSFDLSYDLITVERATPTRDGVSFLKELSLGRTRDDLIAVTMGDDDAGFAADDSGGLFRFSLRTQAFEECDRDNDSRIRSIRVVSWRA